MLSEEEHQALREARMRMYMSAKAAAFQGYSSKEWLRNKNVIEFATKHFIDDELVHFARYIWDHQDDD